MWNIVKHKTAKKKVADKEFPESHFIPYERHFNDHTLLLKDQSLMQVVKLGGFSFETADDEDVDIRKNIRNLLLKGVGTAGVSMYFHIVRRKRRSFEDSDVTQKIEQEGFAADLEEQWRQRNSGNQSYVNELYVTVIKKTKKIGSDFLDKITQKLSPDDEGLTANRVMLEAYDELYEVTSRVVTTLRDYHSELLSVKEVDGCAFCPILEFLGKIVNCGVSAPMQVPNIDIAEYLPTHRLYFGRKAIEVRGPNKSHFAGIVSLKEYGQHTAANMLDSLLQMPFELIVSQSFTFVDRNMAISQMQIQQNKMVQSEDVAVSQVADISQALDDAMSGKIAFGKHHLTVLCLADNLKELERNLAMASTEVGNAGTVPQREAMNMEPAYWAQLPGNVNYAVRRATISTLNLASFVAMHNYPTGKEKDNHWGDCVTTLNTTSGTPFFFNFHVRDIGHTTIIGPTGAGKTVLMNFLCSQAQKYNGRMFFFDKDRGAEIFIRAIRGNYSVIDPGKACGFNPLKLPDTGENRNFLVDWLKSLVMATGEPVTTEDMKRINEAVEGNYKLDFADRRLANIVPFLGIGGPGSLFDRIAMWYGDGPKASIFDNEDDIIDFEKGSVFGFEMAHLLNDKVALSPTLLYIFHRVTLSLDGTPSMIVLDEAWALIDNEVFAPKIKDWLKVLRKLNCFVIFATQSVEDASNSAISDTLIQQTATQIFLPNLKATSVYRTSFMLTEREFTLIKTTDPGTRFFLLKQGNDAVVARVDLSSMPEAIYVLSGDAKTVRILDKVREEVGDDPDDWMPPFLEKAKYA